MAHRFTASDLIKAANISNATYQQWKARGFIKSTFEAKGTGNRQLYSFKELFDVAVMGELVKMGLSISNAAKARLLYGRKDDSQWLVIRRFPILEVDGTEFEDGPEFTQDELVAGRDLSSTLQKYPGAAVVNLNAVEKQVKEALGIHE